MATYNFQAPNIDGDADVNTQLRQVKSYVTNLNEQLRYDLSNIDEDNFKDGEIPEGIISAGFRQKVEDLEGNTSALQQTATAITARVVSAEGDIGSLEITAGNISAEVSSTQVYRAATENALTAALAAYTPARSLAVGLIWYDTTNKLMKRCTAITPAVTWETLQADELHTSYIDIEDDSIDIGSSGSITIAAGGKLRVDADNIVLTAGDDTLDDSLSALSITDGNILAEVSSTQVYRAATEAALISALGAFNPARSLAVGLIWYDTTSKLMKRCLTITPAVTWETLQANEVHTSYIDIEDNSIDIGSSGEINIKSGGALDIESGGNINVASGGDIHVNSGGDLDIESGGNLNIKSGGDIEVESGGDLDIESGGNLNIKSGGDIEVESGGDINIASGGKLNLIAAESIYIGTNPLLVGGTNFLHKSNYNSRLVAVASNSVCGYAIQLRSGVLDTGQITGLSLKTNQDYILSFKYWCTSGTQACSVDLYPDTLPQTTFAVTTALQSFSWVINSSSSDMSSCSLRLFPHPTTPTGTIYITDIKLEVGNVPTDWCEGEGELNNSAIEINNDGIEILSGGDLIATAPGILKITGGSTDDTAIAVRNDTDYFISAGDLTQADAPFYVKKDGSMKASKGTIAGMTMNASCLYTLKDVGGGIFVYTFYIDPSGGTLGDIGMRLGNYVIKSNTDGFYLYNMNNGTSSACIKSHTNYVKLLGITYVSELTVGHSSTSPIYLAVNGQRAYVDNNIYIVGNCSALTFTDRTPAFTGNAIETIGKIKADKKGGIDHSTLPEFARKTIKSAENEGKEVEEEEGRDIGAMISMLTKAVQELTAITTSQQHQIDALTTTTQKQQEQIDILLNQRDPGTIKTKQSAR